MKTLQVSSQLVFPVQTRFFGRCIQNLENYKKFAIFFRSVHQTAHFSTGFMGEPWGQPKASAKSRLFLRVTATLKNKRLNALNGCWYFQVNGLFIVGIKVRVHVCQKVTALIHCCSSVLELVTWLWQSCIHFAPWRWSFRKELLKVFFMLRLVFYSIVMFLPCQFSKHFWMQIISCLNEFNINPALN